MKTRRQLKTRKEIKKFKYKHRGFLYEIERQIRQAKRKAVKLREIATALGGDK